MKRFFQGIPVISAPALLTLIALLVATKVPAQCTPPASGLVGWWKGDGTVTDLVASNNGTLFNSAYSNGVVNQAFSFDPQNYSFGTFTGVKIADRPEYALMNSLTIEGWIRPRGDSYVIFFRGDGRPGLDPYSLSMNGNHELWFSTCNAGGNGTNIIVTIPYDQWVHVAATLSGTNGLMRIYTNGVLAAQKFTSIRPFGALDNSQSPGVGIGNVNDGLNTFPFIGDVDEIALYNRALSQTEIQAIVAAGTAGKCTSVVSVTNNAPVPVIASFTPSSGTNGSLVTILGTNFSATASSNIVYFGAVKANVLGAGTNVLTVQVPVSATFAPITVTVGGLTASAGKPFEPTFSGNGSNFTSSSFSPSFNLGTSAGPVASVIADLDGDGKPDIALLNGYSNTVSIFRNISTNGTPLGTASFAPRVDLTFPTNGLGGDLYRLRAVDLDGDGRLDLIAGVATGNHVSIFHNIATPGTITTNSFDAPFVLNAGNDIRSIAAADLDGDGRVDILVGNYADNTLSIFKNIGTVGSLNVGSFAAPFTVATPAGPYDMAIGDLDGDGKPDLAMVSSLTTVISVFKNTATQGTLNSSSFATRVDFPSQLGGDTLAIGDLDGDGKADLIAGFGTQQVISVFRNLSTPGFFNTNSLASPVNFSLPGWVHVVTLADFNGDGKPDVGVVGELSSYLAVFQNTSTPGSFTAASLAPQVDFGTGWNAWGVAAGDLDGDGRPDAVFCNSYDANIQIYQNVFPFAAPPLAPASCTTAPAGIVGWWSGENNSADYTGTNNGALTVSGASYAAGKVGQGFRFDGTNGYLQIPDSASLKPATITVEAWVWLDPSMTNIQSEQIIFKKNTWSFFFEGYSLLKEAIDATTSRFSFVVTRNGNQVITRSITTVQRGVWYHVAATYDGSTQKLFVNGVQEASAFAGFALDYDTTPVFVGSSGIPGNYVNYLTGIIDEPTIYSRALATNEIAAIYTASSAGKCGAPVVVPQPVVLVDASNPGFYNDSLGTILDGTSAQFPIPFGSGGGDPTFYPASEPNLAPAASILGNWLNNPSALNSNWRSVGNVPSTWSLNDETAIIYQINGGSNGIASLWGDFDVDNGIYIWVNGVFKFGACAPGLPSPVGQFEYTNIFLGGLLPGTNYVQVLREDNGISTGYQIRVRGSSVATNPVPATCTPPPSGLVAWWQSESNLLDSIGGSIATVNGALAYTNGEVGQAFVFDGSTSYLSFPASSNLDIGATGSGITVECWIMPSAFDVDVSGAPIVEWDSAFTDGLQFWSGGNLFANINDTTGTGHTFASANGILTTNSWQHVALTYDKASGNAVIYRNGIVVATNSVGTVTPQTTYPLNIGRRTGQPIGLNDTYGGLMDELSLYKRALSQGEIQAIYNAGSAGKCNSSSTLYSSSLVLDLPLDGSAVDVGPNNFTVTTNGGGLFVTNRFLQQGSALALDGVGQNLSIPFDARLNPTEFTFSAWAKFQSFQGTFWRSGDANADSWRGFGLAVDGGVLNYQDFNGSNYNAQVYAASNMVAGNWYQLVVTRTTNACVVYVNGIPTGSQNGLTPYAKAQVTPMSFGSNAGFPGGSAQFAQFCPVTLDTVHLYSRALSSNEVAQLYQFEAPVGPTLIAPSITQQPTNITVTVNNTAVFNVAATGTQPLSYQWSLNGTNILGATNTTLTLNNVSPALAGNYSVLVSNFVGTVTSSNAVLNVYVPPTPPTILSQTPSQVVMLGSAATFTVNAGGTAPLRYFWFKNNVLIPGATNFFYTIPSAQFADSGKKFSCLVTNAYGTASSTNSSLKVINTIYNDLCSGAVVITNSSYTNLQSTANASSYGDPMPDCVDGFGNGVWYSFTAPVSGMLDVDTYGSDFDTGLAIYAGSCGSLTQVDCNDDTDGFTSELLIPTTAGVTYYFLVGGYSAHVGNLVFHLHHFTPPAFDVQPTNIAVIVSSNGQFSATISGTQPISQQWYFNNAPLADGGRISGVTNTTLNIAGVITNDGGNYYLVASNWVGVTTSSVAVLTPIILPPFFLVQPSSQSVLTGSNVTFSTVVDGTAPYAYQWYRNGSPLADNANITGSTTLSLSISNLTTANAGNYTLLVTNVAGATNSLVAVLTVLVPPSIALNPISRSVPPGLPTVFNGAATGILAPAYQWQLNGTNIPGATFANYTNLAVSVADPGFYTFTASNSVGIATSAAAQLTFGPVAAWGKNASNECLTPPNLSNVVNVAGNLGASFGLRADGSVVAWGGGAGTNVPLNATNAVAIFGSGNTAAAVLRADGSVVGWNISGMPVLTNVVSLSVSNTSGTAVRANGTLVGWGFTPYSSFLTNLNHVTAVSIGYPHGLALRDDGTVVAWGSGAGTNVPASLANVTAIAAGNFFSLALQSSGKVVAWGASTFTNLPVGATNITAISVNNASTGQVLCQALRADGRVFAWGSTGNGETNPPAALQSLTTSAIAAGTFHGLALVNDGSPQIIQPPIGLTVYSGRDVTLRGVAAGATPLSYQWLFNGTNIDGATNANLSLANLQVANTGGYQLFVSNYLGTAISIPAALNVIVSPLTIVGQNTATLTNLYQAGKFTVSGFTVNGSGPLRYQWFFSRTNNGYTPIVGATNDTLVKDPAFAFDTGNYYVSVSNLVGGLTSAPVNVRVLFARGFGYTGMTNPPVNVTNAVALATGGTSGSSAGHYVVLGADGKVTSWANYLQTSGSFGETNLSAWSNSIVTAIAASASHTLALKSDGTVAVFGGGATNIPAGLNGVTAIACGSSHDLALKSDGTVVGWLTPNAINYGQATNTVAATNIVAIAAGQYHSLGLRADGTVIGWGNSDGTTTIPTTTVNASIAIAAGNGFSVALRTNGTVVQWGRGIASYPVPPNLSNVVSISASGQHVSALKNDGTVVSWGFEYLGLAASNLPPDLTNVVGLASGGEHDIALFGTRAPAFTVQPWNRAVTLSPTFVSSFALVGKVAGVQPMSYQWRLNGTNYPGETNDTFVWRDSQHPAGTYQLVASNSYGVTVSKPAKVSIVIPLAVALDTTTLNWLTSGSAPWYGQTNYVHPVLALVNSSAARSGGIGGVQESILQTTLITNFPGSISFWWKISSEQFFDTLEFRINGTVQASISGEVDWTFASFPVNAGTNVLMWRYSKDSSFDSGLDAAFVDQFVFASAPVINVQPVSVIANAGQTVSLRVVAAGIPAPSYQWMQNGNPVGGNSSLLTLNNVARAQVGTYSVIVTNLGGMAISSNAAVVVKVPQLLGTPVLLPDGSLQLTSTDMNGGTIQPSDLANFEAQASTDLVNWTILPGGLSLTNGMLQLNDAVRTNFTSRYYRIVEH